MPPYILLLYSHIAVIRRNCLEDKSGNPTGSKSPNMSYPRHPFFKEGSYPSGIEIATKKKNETYIVVFKNFALSVSKKLKLLI